MPVRKTREKRSAISGRKPDFPDGVREDDTTARMMENATAEGTQKLGSKPDSSGNRMPADE